MHRPHHLLTDDQPPSSTTRMKISTLWTNKRKKFGLKYKTTRTSTVFHTLTENCKLVKAQSKCCRSTALGKSKNLLTSRPHSLKILAVLARLRISCETRLHKTSLNLYKKVLKSIKMNSCRRMLLVGISTKRMVAAFLKHQALRILKKSRRSTSFKQRTIFQS